MIEREGIFLVAKGQIQRSFVTSGISCFFFILIMKEEGFSKNLYNLLLHTGVFLYLLFLRSTLLQFSSEFLYPSKIYLSESSMQIARDNARLTL